MIDGLVGRGVVTRVEDPADRRAVLISLTDAGADALAAKVEEYSRVRVQLARTLEPEERLVAADLLNRLAVVIEEL
jgi:DNA-binding MarR family transcriptional regulator